MEDVKDQEVSKRYKTLPISQIDAEHLGPKISRGWKKINEAREQFLARKQEYTNNWRDMDIQRTQGPWENSSDFKVPLTLSLGKATHARLWQLFSDMDNFFGVKARTAAFEDRESTIKQFMQFVITQWANGKQGIKDVLDEFLWENVFDGSGYLKLYFQRDTHKYMEVVPVATVEEKLVFDPNSLTGRTDYNTTLKENDVLKEEIVETPHIKRILMEDIALPVGQGDPQTSTEVYHRIFFTDDELKARAAEGKYDRDQVSEAIKHRFNAMGDIADENKRAKMEADGFQDKDGYFEDYHSVFEWYGKAYIKKDLSNERDLEMDIDEMPEDVVIWTHQASGLVLGWTYLYRISPSGIRPIFKSDFIRFPDRSHGVGVAEALAPIEQAMNAIYNLRQDNGTLASTPMGFYRAGSGLKPDTFRVEPGSFFPTDDPNDVKVVQIPFLNGFGYQEEDRLRGYAEGLINISDIQLGKLPSKVGTFRTASGANMFEQQSGIQLEIHFDRLARTMNKLLQALFVLARERMPEQLFYRITGENGQPIFGKVNREDLKGSYDFEINVDILGESRTEGQQKAVMMMQTLINPAFTNTGVVTPSNLYHLAKNFILKNRVRGVDNYISKPKNFTEDVISPSERVFRIVVNNFTDPPIENTVRLDEDHQAALQFYDSFKQSDHFGLMHTPQQLQALDRVIQRHHQLMAAQQAGGNPNLSGMQVPREGFTPMPANPQDQGPLGSPQGEANGPVS